MRYNNEKYKDIYLKVRRGILELDLIFSKYIKHSSFSDNVLEKKVFNELLKRDDIELFNWIVVRKKPEGKFINIIKKIINLNTQHVFEKNKIKTTL